MVRTAVHISESSNRSRRRNTNRPAHTQASQRINPRFVPLASQPLNPNRSSRNRKSADTVPILFEEEAQWFDPDAFMETLTGEAPADFIPPISISQVLDPL